jgi:ParB/RepB/Spo0J family partition protein
MTRLPPGKTRLDLVREAAATLTPGQNIKRGRMIVSIDRLAEDPRNERRTFTGMDELIASIKQVGLVEPITVTAEADGVLRIVTGHRRYRAAKAAGLAQVEVIVRDPEDERLRRMKSVISNVQREDVNAVEMAEALQAMIDDGFAADQSDLARSIGKERRWVSEILAVLKLPTDMIDRIKQHPVSYDTAARIARVKNKGLQHELIDLASTGASGRAIRRHVEAATGKGRSTEATSLPKPKRVFRTSHRVTIVVQADTTDLKHADVLAGLRDALDQATRFLN